MENNRAPQPATEQRKTDHIQIVLSEEDTQYAAAGITTGLEYFHLVHSALPDLDMNEIDMTTTFLKRRINAPLIISSMTGGTPLAEQINHNLAVAAQACGVAMGVGSQRAAIENPALASTYKVRSLAPDIPLLANLGAVQFNYGYGIDQCRAAVEMLEADALILHLNPLQEAIQPEGDTNFKGLLPKIEAICRQLEVPVIVKEIGQGISMEVAQKLRDAGVAAIDTAGAGGTSWGQVEKHRMSPERRAIAAAFAGWGIPTVASIRQARLGAPDLTLIASGGLRSGLDAAKSIALGADLAGIAAPFLKAATVSADAVIAEINVFMDTLRIAMFCTGSANLDALKHAPFL